MVLGKVLRQHQPPCPAEGAGRASELQKAMHPPVPADAPRHGFVFLHAGPGQFQPQFQQLLHDAVRASGRILHHPLCQRFHGDLLIRQPRLELPDASGVFQPRQRLGPLERSLRKRLIDRHRVFHQQPIHPHAPVVDALIQRVQRPFVFRERMPEQRMADRALGFHVLRVVGFVGRPLLRRVPRQVARASAVGLGRLAGHGKVADEVLAFLHLFFRNVQSHRDVRQFSRQRPVPRHDHGAAPLRRIEPVSQMLGEAHPLKGRVVRNFQDSRVLQRMKEFIRQRFPARHVDGCHRRAVKGIGQQEDLEIRGVAVAVHAALGEGGGGIGFYVQMHNAQAHHLQIKRRTLADAPVLCLRSQSAVSLGGSSLRSSESGSITTISRFFCHAYFTVYCVPPEVPFLHTARRASAASTMYRLRA